MDIKGVLTLNIFYCHGFGSTFDPGKSKIQTLAELGTVSGVDFDYTQPAEKTVARCIEALSGNDIDLVVGTSMGGWLASVAGSRAGIPFVAINPAIDPAKTLVKYIGAGVDYQGIPYSLEAAAVKNYWPLPFEGCGLMLLDEGDDILDSAQTASIYGHRFDLVSFPGGSHRFDHMKESLSHIQAFFDGACLVYGLDES